MTELIEEHFSFFQYFQACKKSLHARLCQMPLINLKKQLLEKILANNFALPEAEDSTSRTPLLLSRTLLAIHQKL